MALYARFMIQRLNNVEIAILLKVNFIINQIPIKLIEEFVHVYFTEKLILKFTQKCEDPSIAKQLLKGNKVGEQSSLHCNRTKQQ